MQEQTRPPVFPPGGVWQVYDVLQKERGGPRTIGPGRAPSETDRQSPLPPQRAAPATAQCSAVRTEQSVTVLDLEILDPPSLQLADRCLALYGYSIQARAT
jgi:hypothetical protein